MRDYSHNRRAEEAGQRLGQVVRWLRFRGRGGVLRNTSPVISRVLLWVVGLVIVGALVFATFWLALLLMFAWAVIKLLPHVSRSCNSDVPEWKWRQGLLGFGLYNQSGIRIDSHDRDRDA